MKVIAHRGYWKKVEEKNSLSAIKSALEYGYGFETDLRDYNGELVISHNIPDSKCFKAEDVFSYYREIGSSETIALNIKSDGIQDLLEKNLEKYKITNYFLFDMSVPEMVANNERKLIFYTRQSDVEKSCVLYEQSAGVWLDSFYDGNWLNPCIIRDHIIAEKQVCIVSPELHNKDYGHVWKMIKDNKFHENSLVSICTDIPDEAREFFEL